MEDYGLISVIIPVYNSEKYLEQCVQSVLAQTYKNYEIILVDDGSSDDSGILCDEYASKFKNIRVLHKENGGASSARNVGLQEARGKYLYFLDSDDWIVPDMLIEVIGSAKSNSADLVFFEGRSISECGNERGNYEYLKDYSSNVPHTVMSEMLNNKEFHVGTPFFFILKEIFTRNNLLFKEGVMYEDMLMSYQLFCLAKKVAHVHKKLYVRRYHENSVMTSQISGYNFKSILSVFKSVVAFSDSIPVERVQNKHIVRCAYNVINIYNCLSSKDKSKYKDDYLNLKRDILNRNAFYDKGLKMRCYGYIPWFVYKSVTKVFGG